jgi:cyclic beta-1,2-glucan synthetase
LEPLEEIEIVLLLGQADKAADIEILTSKYLRADETERAFLAVQSFWNGFLGAVQFKTPSEEINLLLNRWLLYQTLSCRLWARTGFYQSGGAYGFRDQLQDVLAVLKIKPEIARQQILLAAQHQFLEGDVLHWWHPPSDRGVRTHFSDDLLWLPYVVCEYIKVTGDLSLLDEKLPFLEAPQIPLGHEDLYIQPEISQEVGSLFEHCARAIDISLKTGAHGLPLMGTGDWNDGMNRVGFEGKGESVWLAWFLISVLKGFSPHCEMRNETERLRKYQNHITAVSGAVEANGWDGMWYKRAFFDDGTPLGSADNDECQIDSIAQSWSVLSGVAPVERATLAMKSVETRLIREAEQIVLLFSPSFDKTKLDPGYIKGYVPGIRENGGQYTHAAIWAAMAFAELGNHDLAMEVLMMLNPIAHTASRAGAHKYKVEPYVMPADVYGLPPHTGRGGWTWYTGSAGWYYQALTESILGLKKRDGNIYLRPRLPESWNGFEMKIQLGGKSHHVAVKRTEDNGFAIDLDGRRLDSSELVLGKDEALDEGAGPSETKT